MKQIQILLMKYTSLFVFCGLIYVGIEILFRQRSDHTMFFLAGFCGTVFLTGLNNLFSYELDYILQVLMSGTCCTLSEWVCGRLVNMDYHIWDYRGLWLSSADGQVNFFFFLAWCVISALAIPCLDYIEWRVFSYHADTPPYYKIFGRIRFQFHQGIRTHVKE
ncbi:hypothetical protein MCG98_11605 [Ruminococcus sp. OA3]|uniref:hypothetical protein n=1 Tax=Ruminococcus sp. OA3 TaxID=2914164 RepID=UPI001F060523|nr:hypothetical protein [Ruminococcus sp. OA3]MCH1983212.1 hypothetical protein [Ruminococcus sp. OA3]